MSIRGDGFTNVDVTAAGLRIIIVEYRFYFPFHFVPSYFSRIKPLRLHIRNYCQTAVYTYTYNQIDASL